MSWCVPAVAGSGPAVDFVCCSSLRLPAPWGEGGGASVGTGVGEVLVTEVSWKSLLLWAMSHVPHLFLLVGGPGGRGALEACLGTRPSLSCF